MENLLYRDHHPWWWFLSFFHSFFPALSLVLYSKVIRPCIINAHHEIKSMHFTALPLVKWLKIPIYVLCCKHTHSHRYDAFKGYLCLHWEKDMDWFFIPLYFAEPGWIYRCFWWLREFLIINGFHRELRLPLFFKQPWFSYNQTNRIALTYTKDMHFLLKRFSERIKFFFLNHCIVLHIIRRRAARKKDIEIII